MQALRAARADLQAMAATAPLSARTSTQRPGLARASEPAQARAGTPPPGASSTQAAIAGVQFRSVSAWTGRPGAGRVAASSIASRRKTALQATSASLRRVEDAASARAGAQSSASAKARTPRRVQPLPGVPQFGQLPSVRRHSAADMVTAMAQLGSTPYAPFMPWTTADQAALLRAEPDAAADLASTTGAGALLARQGYTNPEGMRLLASGRQNVKSQARADMSSADAADNALLHSTASQIHLHMTLLDARMAAAPDEPGHDTARVTRPLHVQDVNVHDLQPTLRAVHVPDVLSIMPVPPSTSGETDGSAGQPGPGGLARPGRSLRAADGHAGRRRALVDSAMTAAGAASSSALKAQLLRFAMGVRSFKSAALAEEAALRELWVSVKEASAAGAAAGVVFGADAEAGLPSRPLRAALRSHGEAMGMLPAVTHGVRSAAGLAVAPDAGASSSMLLPSSGSDAVGLAGTASWAGQLQVHAQVPTHVTTGLSVAILPLILMRLPEPLASAAVSAMQAVVAGVYSMRPREEGAGDAQLAGHSLQYDPVASVTAVCTDASLLQAARRGDAAAAHALVARWVGALELPPAFSRAMSLSLQMRALSRVIAAARATTESLEAEGSRREGVFDATVRRWQRGFVAAAFKAWSTLVRKRKHQAPKTRAFMKRKFNAVLATQQRAFKRWATAAHACRSARLAAELSSLKESLASEKRAVQSLRTQHTQVAAEYARLRTVALATAQQNAALRMAVAAGLGLLQAGGEPQWLALAASLASTAQATMGVAASWRSPDAAAGSVAPAGLSHALRACSVGLCGATTYTAAETKAGDFGGFQAPTKPVHSAAVTSLILAQQAHDLSPEVGVAIPGSALRAARASSSARPKDVTFTAAKPGSVGVASNASIAGSSSSSSIEFLCSQLAQAQAADAVHACVREHTQSASPDVQPLEQPAEPQADSAEESGSESELDAAPEAAPAPEPASPVSSAVALSGKDAAASLAKLLAAQPDLLRQANWLPASVSAAAAAGGPSAARAAAERCIAAAARMLSPLLHSPVPETLAMLPPAAQELVAAGCRVLEQISGAHASAGHAYPQARASIRALLCQASWAWRPMAPVLQLPLLGVPLWAVQMSAHAGLARDPGLLFPALGFADQGMAAVQGARRMPWRALAQAGISHSHAASIAQFAAQCWPAHASSTEHWYEQLINAACGSSGSTLASSLATLRGTALLGAQLDEGDAPVLFAALLADVAGQPDVQLLSALSPAAADRAELPELGELAAAALRDVPPAAAVLQAEHAVAASARRTAAQLQLGLLHGGTREQAQSILARCLALESTSDLRSSTQPPALLAGPASHSALHMPAGGVRSGNGLLSAALDSEHTSSKESIAPELEAQLAQLQLRQSAEHARISEGSEQGDSKELSDVSGDEGTASPSLPAMTPPGSSAAAEAAAPMQARLPSALRAELAGALEVVGMPGKLDDLLAQGLLPAQLALERAVQGMETLDPRLAGKGPGTQGPKYKAMTTGETGLAMQATLLQRGLAQPTQASEQLLVQALSWSSATAQLWRRPSSWQMHQAMAVDAMLSCVQAAQVQAALPGQLLGSAAMPPTTVAAVTALQHWACAYQAGAPRHELIAAAEQALPQQEVHAGLWRELADSIPAAGGPGESARARPAPGKRRLSLRVGGMDQAAVQGQAPGGGPREALFKSGELSVAQGFGRPTRRVNHASALQAVTALLEGLLKHSAPAPGLQSESGSPTPGASAASAQAWISRPVRDLLLPAYAEARRADGSSASPDMDPFGTAKSFLATGQAAAEPTSALPSISDFQAVRRSAPVAAPQQAGASGAGVHLDARLSSVRFAVAMAGGTGTARVLGMDTALDTASVPPGLAAAAASELSAAAQKEAAVHEYAHATAQAHMDQAVWNAMLSGAQAATGAAAQYAGAEQVQRQAELAVQASVAHAGGESMPAGADLGSVVHAGANAADRGKSTGRVFTLQAFAAIPFERVRDLLLEIAVRRQCAADSTLLRARDISQLTGLAADQCDDVTLPMMLRLGWADTKALTESSEVQSLVQAEWTGLCNAMERASATLRAAYRQFARGGVADQAKSGDAAAGGSAYMTEGEFQVLCKTARLVSSASATRKKLKAQAAALREAAEELAGGGGASANSRVAALADSLVSAGPRGWRVRGISTATDVAALFEVVNREPRASVNPGELEQFLVTDSVAVSADVAGVSLQKRRTEPASSPVSASRSASAKLGTLPDAGGRRRPLVPSSPRRASLAPKLAAVSEEAFREDDEEDGEAGQTSDSASMSSASTELSMEPAERTVAAGAHLGQGTALVNLTMAVPPQSRSSSASSVDSDASSAAAAAAAMLDNPEDELVPEEFVEAIVRFAALKLLHTTSGLQPHVPVHAVASHAGRAATSPTASTGMTPSGSATRRDVGSHQLASAFQRLVEEHIVRFCTGASPDAFRVSLSHGSAATALAHYQPALRRCYMAWVTAQVCQERAEQVQRIQALMPAMPEPEVAPDGTPAPTPAERLQGLATTLRVGAGDASGAELAALHIDVAQLRNASMAGLTMQGWAAGVQGLASPAFQRIGRATIRHIFAAAQVVGEDTPSSWDESAEAESDAAGADSAMVGNSVVRLVFPEFCEAMAALAVHVQRNPFMPLSAQLAGGLKQALQPFRHD